MLLLLLLPSDMLLLLLLLPSDMLLLLLQHLLLVALLVAPQRGAPAAPAPSLASGVEEEEGGRQAAEEAKLRRLPTGSIVAPLSRAELFQRPRPRIGSSSLSIPVEIANLSRRTPRPRSLGGRRLKAGSEVNSLREKAIKAEGSSRQEARHPSRRQQLKQKKEKEQTESCSPRESRNST